MSQNDSSPRCGRCVRCLQKPWIKRAMCGLSGLAILTTIAAGVCVMIYGDGGGVDEHFNKFMKGFMKDGLLVIEGSATIPVWTMIPAGVALLGMFPILCGNATSCRKGNAVVLLLISILVAVFMPSIFAEILAANAPDAPDAEVQVEVPDDFLTDETITDETIIAVSVGGGVSALAGVGGAIVANSGIFSKKSEAENKCSHEWTESATIDEPRQCKLCGEKSTVLWERPSSASNVSASVEKLKDAADPVEKRQQEEAVAAAAPVELQEVLSLADNPTNASTSQPGSAPPASQPQQPRPGSIVNAQAPEEVATEPAAPRQETAPPVVAKTSEEEPQDLAPGAAPRQPSAPVGPPPSADVSSMLSQVHRFRDRMNTTELGIAMDAIKGYQEKERNAQEGGVLVTPGAPEQLPATVTPGAPQPTPQPGMADTPTNGVLVKGSAPPVVAQPTCGCGKGAIGPDGKCNNPECDQAEKRRRLASPMRRLMEDINRA